MPTGKSVLKLLPQLQPGHTPSRTATPILPRPDAGTSRSVDINHEWQVTRGAPKVGKVPEGAREDSMKQGMLSQVSNDSIESWSDEATFRGDGVQTI
jgi:hypothetical protein